LTAGESALIATSTSIRIAKAGSSSIVRSSRSITVRRSRSRGSSRDPYTFEQCAAGRDMVSDGRHELDDSVIPHGEVRNRGPVERHHGKNSPAKSAASLRRVIPYAIRATLSEPITRIESPSIRQ
jgi:hypothetical protein